MSGYVYAAPGVQDYLKNAILTALGGDEVPCDVGFPAGGLAKRHIWIRGDLNLRFPRRTSGGGQRDEDGSLLVRVWVTKTADTLPDVRDDALELAQVVEAAIAGDPTFGGRVHSAHVEKAVGNEGVDKTTRQYGIELTVKYQTSVARSG